MSYWNIWATATSVGKALMQLANPSAIRFVSINADNTVTALSAAAASLAMTTPVVLTGDDAITVQASTVFLEKTSAGAYTIAAPSSQDGLRITIIGNTDFAHIVTFTGTTLLDGTTGANVTATFTAFKGSSITVVARGAFWLVESLNLVVCAP